MTTALLTLFALLAFAANSILARLALGDISIDPASYTAVRLATGAATLCLIVRVPHVERSPGSADVNWTAAVMLFVYAATFSFAYISLSAGTGALILFAAVQISMIAAGLFSGERPSAAQWLGLLIAIAGLIYLVSPGLTAPSAFGSLLMGTAGIAWGVYSLLGRGVTSPVRATAKNFIRSVPLALVVLVAWWGSLELSTEGLILAALSGSLTSAVGYVIWYAALRGLTATLAATVQLSVPVLAAMGGVFFLSEELTLRLILAAALILTGVGLAIVSHRT